MDENKTDISEISTGYLIHKASHYCKMAGLQLFKDKEYGLTPEQFVVLYILFKQEGLYQRQLAKLTLKDRPNITRILDILEKRDFVARETAINNRRIVKVFITHEGRMQVAKILPDLYEAREKTIKGLSEEEIRILEKTLKKICENLTESFKLQI